MIETGFTTRIFVYNNIYNIELQISLKESIKKEQEDPDC